MTAEFYTNNRDRLLDKLEGTGVILLYSGMAPVKSNDQDMSPFSVNRNFYYLTGIDTQNVWLLLAKTKRGSRSWLFIDEPDEEIIKWNGKMLTKERASERSGLKISNIQYMQDFDRYAAMYLSNGLTDVYFSLHARPAHPRGGAGPDRPRKIPHDADQKHRPHDRLPPGHQDP